MLAAPTASHVRVGLDRNGNAHVMGVSRCGSSSSCPVCTPTIRDQRAREVEEGVANHLAAGGGALFVTLTQPHAPGDDLARLIASNQTAWTHTREGGKWSRFKKAHGIVGQIKAVEATYGDANGWHPHLHVILLTAAPVGPKERRQVWGWILDQWSMGLARSGRTPGNRRHLERYGVDVRSVTSSEEAAEALGRYVTKIKEGWSIGQEVARGDVKGHGDARRVVRDGQVVESSGRWHPFELLAAAVEDGDSWAGDRWDEWDRGMKGVASVTWSPGLKARLGVEDLSDEELVSVAADEIAAYVDIPADEWRAYVLARRGGELLNEITAALLPWARYRLTGSMGEHAESPEPVPIAA